MTQIYTVKECLQGYTSEALGTICSNWQLAARTRPSRLRAVERVLTDALHVTKALEALPAEAARLLNLIARRERVTLLDAASVPGLVGDGPGNRALHRVAEWGLVLISPKDRSGAFSFEHLTRQNYTYETAPVLLLPDLVAEHLPDPPPLRVELPGAPDVQEPKEAGALDGAAAAFLETLRLIEVLAPRVTAQGTLHKADLGRAREMMRDAHLTNEAFELSLMAARQLGCLDTRDRRLVTTSKVGQWAEEPPADRARDLFRAYLESREIPDLKLFFPEIAGALDEHLPAKSLRRTYHRELVVRILEVQDTETWHPIDSVADAVHRLDYNVLFLDEHWRAIQSHAKNGSPAWKTQSWRSHEHRLFCWMIQSLFAKLGIVQVSEDQKAFRLTRLGQYVVGVGEPPQKESAGTAPEASTGNAVVVQPDFEVIAYLDRCSLDLRRKLDLFCQRQNGGIVRTYRLTQESVYRGVRSGASISVFLDLLEASSQRPIPENVREQFATWQRKLQSVVIRPSCQVLEFKTAKEARTFVGAHSEARLVGERFVLTSEAPGEVSSRIDYTRPRGACLQQEDGLQLRAPWEAVHLFLKRRLDTVCDVAADKNLDLVVSLTPEGVKNGVDWSLIAADLESLVTKPLASRYRTALKAWSGDLAPAQSATATLVRFEDAEACEAALELADVAGCVEGRLGLYTVVVRQGRLAAFKRILKAHGLKIKPTKSLPDDGPPETWALSWVEEHEAQEVPEEDEARADDKNAAEEQEEVALPSYPPRIIREILEDAILRRRSVLIQYQSPWSPAPGTRLLNPLAIDVTGAAPSLSAYCHRQQANRLFRLSRILGIRVREEETF